jgi:hypothetical protein
LNDDKKKKDDQEGPRTKLAGRGMGEEAMALL